MPCRDTIETALTDDAELGVPLDIIGWDIRKALQLAAKSNVPLIEWLTLPVCYMENAAAGKLLHFAKSCADLNNLTYHPKFPIVWSKVTSKMSFIHISDGKLHDVNVLDLLITEPGAFYVMGPANQL